MEHDKTNQTASIQVAELMQKQLSITMDGVSHLLQAVQVLAVPEWFDDQIAIYLLEKIGCNGGTSSVLSVLKSLPFVHSHEGGWVYEDVARRYFINQLLDGNGNADWFKTRSSDIASFLQNQRQENLGREKNRLGLDRESAYINRELELRSFSHQLPSDSETAVKGILDFYQQADHEGRTSDQRAVESIFHRQQRWVRQKLELAYFEGRYQYNRQGINGKRQAEPYFLYVYDLWRDYVRSRDALEADVERDTHYKLLVAPVTHFLGIILRDVYEPIAWDLAESLMQESIRLNQELSLERHEGEVRNTLSSLYRRWGRFREAKQQLDQAKAIFSALEDRYNESRVDTALERLKKQKEKGWESRPDTEQPNWGVLSARVVGQYPGELLQAGKVYELEVRLQRSIAAEEEDLCVTVFSSSAEIETSWQKSLHLDKSRYSQATAFTFQVSRAGLSQIELDLYYKRHWLQKLNVNFEATNAPDGR